MTIRHKLAKYLPPVPSAPSLVVGQIIKMGIFTYEITKVTGKYEYEVKFLEFVEDKKEEVKDE